MTMESRSSSILSISFTDCGACCVEFCRRSRRSNRSVGAHDSDSDRHPSRYPPVVTWMLIAANCTVFLIQISMIPFEQQPFLLGFGLLPAGPHLARRWRCGISPHTAARAGHQPGRVGTPRSQEATMQVKQQLAAARARWKPLTSYQKFEHVVILILTVLICIIVAL